MERLTKLEVSGFFLIGAFVGAATALLYAPKTGAQTRRDIRKYSKRAAERLDDLTARLN